MTLYDLEAQYKALEELIESGEYTPEELADTMEAIDGDFEAKADGYCKVMRNMIAAEMTIDQEIAILSAKKKVLENGVKNLKARLYDTMKAINKPKFKTALFSYSIRKNGGKQPMEITGSILDIPEEYIVTRAEPDNEAIRRALEAGEVLPFAHLKERGESLVIK